MKGFWGCDIRAVAGNLLHALGTARDLAHQLDAFDFSLETSADGPIEDAR